jgi:hypothetical protein
MSLAKHTILAVALLVATTATAAADVVIVRKESGADGRASTTRIQLTKHAARIEGEGGTLIYRKDLDTAWMIRGDSYVELDKAAARALKQHVTGQMDQMQDQIDEALAAVPADKRAMVEEMMRNGAVPGMPQKAPPPKPRQPAFVKGADGTVGSWSCTGYEGSLDGAVVERVCTAGLEQIGLNDADVDIMYDAAKFFWQLGAEMGTSTSAPPSDALGIAEEQGFPGYALSRKRFKSGALASESTVTEVSRTDLDPALFAKPALKRLEFGAPPR